MLSISMALCGSASGITAIVLGILTMIRKASIWLPLTGMALTAASGLWFIHSINESPIQSWW
ncbi:hypothetical protein [Arthrobacter bambusae]|uniref:VIT1/CCC1 family predicted Fe2+/Mn2+ transporter n=1 Tax=Arthrobacter bambusae TaxID=1338426 RepID=A0AAW8DD08_9MICC|nr:hypothetical protein [Arthrobacter bambusae]MDP9903175.1 VIT1/CCC1 family predicted Fe2+/Mn2+ transporter [Arthrobacter bambusae]MDQ0128831.1 VIT1/CCC1 family predicted Fe2+/Mn2+ transporter [Arthrobacter bambusae]MDQ0180172.1 VIT1/CCC1 family predicted Fe2+/Mn2+ transporter [Arthrobacter bambusae]